MNIDISYWRKKGRNLYEYPDSYTPLKTYGMLSKKPFKEAWTTHLSVERSGDLMCYIFYKYLDYVQASVGLNIYINGYAYTSLGELEALITPMLAELAYQSDAATGIIEAKMLELRTELADTETYRAKPLEPVNYAIDENYFQDFYWKNEEVKRIVRSTETGMTHIRFFHSYQYSTPDPEPPIKLNTDTDTDLEEKEENNLPEKEKENKPPKKEGGSERIIPVIIILVNIAIIFLKIIFQ